MDQIGEYRIQRLLGEGGMGRVYAAEERLSKRPVALKVLRPELTHEGRARRLFIREMEILAHLEHPNIVRSFASIEAEGQLVAVLEQLCGRTLREHLAQGGPLSWDRAVGVTVEVARALAAAHGHEPPIVHRDLKPENVMVLDDGAVKVMDFGIAKLLGELSPNHTLGVGTPQYMSPEQLEGGVIDHRSDLYGLGVLLHEMLTGEPPLGPSAGRARSSAPPHERSTREPALLGRSPRGVHALLLQLLDADPAARPESAAAVVAYLEPFLPAPAAPTTALEPRASGTEPAAPAALGSWHATAARAAWLHRFALATGLGAEGAWAPVGAGSTEPADCGPSVPGPGGLASRSEPWWQRAKAWSEGDLSPRAAALLVTLMTLAAALATVIWRGLAG